jgi:hypothetical protein
VTLPKHQGRLPTIATMTVPATTPIHIHNGIECVAAPIAMPTPIPIPIQIAIFWPFIS